MKTVLKTLVIAALVLLGLQAFAQLLKPTDNGDSKHVLESITQSKAKEEIVHVSVTPNGEVSLATEDLMQLNEDLPDIIAETAIESSEAGCHCFGKITADCYSTGALGSYSANCNTAHHRPNCCTQVKNHIAALTAAQKQSIATCLCSKGLADNTPIYATNAIGTQAYESCPDKIATIHQKPAYSVTTCTCPKGWLANPTNVDGGVTADGKCKKAVCGWDAAVFPGYPANVAIGTWGFTWQNGIYAWGTTANGGAPNCVTVNYPAGPCTVSWP
jgi:hypothetical protein